MVHPMLFLVVAAGYALAFYLFALCTEIRQGEKERTSFGSFDLPLEFGYGRLFAVSLLGLFLEMLMIRWLSSEIRIFAYYKNFVLIACYLGFGLGAALCRRRVHPIAMAVPILFFTVLIAAPIPGTHEAITNLTNLIGMTSQAQIWDVAVPNRLSYTALTFAIVAVAPLFAAIAFMFVPLGQMVGAMLETAPRGPLGYTINVAGSLLGIVLYTLICLLYQPPAIWFLVAALLFTIVFLRNRASLLVFVGSCLLAATALTLWIPKGSRVYWSPYQKLTLTPVWDNDEVVAYWLNTNDSWYQQILNLSPSFLERHKGLIAGEDPKSNPYDAPYFFMSSPRSVLVLGAGMGNDVAAALRNTKAAITAVEIDPMILELGERLHFEKPYQSERVKIINDDARSYVQNSHDKFDLIVFSLLDSHTTASSFSNIRLDNFVYTQEAIARASELLNPEGLMILKFQVRSPWIEERLNSLLQHAFHRVPFEIALQTDHGSGGLFFITGSEEAMQRLSQNSIFPKLRPAPTDPHTTLTTDDWPYFYQKERRLPAAILGMGGFLIVFSWYLVRHLLGSSPQETNPARNAHFFLLGAGFMLLEAQIVSKMALLFGTTWMVNSIVVSGLLLLIVISNLIFEVWKSYPLALPYVGIVVSAMLSYLIPLRSLMFEHLGARIMISTVLLCLPVLFAGMVFIRSFAESQFSGPALGWNLIGGVLGGMLETVSQATGIRALVLIAIGLYIGSWIAHSRKAEERAEAKAVAEEALAGVL